jgi:hypothetical protein
MQQNCEERFYICVKNFTYFEPQSPMHYLVDGSFDVLHRSLWLLFYLALMSIVYFLIAIEGEMSSLGNVYLY